MEVVPAGECSKRGHSRPQKPRLGRLNVILKAIANHKRDDRQQLLRNL
jgi:hypothetical protein